MAKNPFKKQNIVDAAINIAIGGAANVAVDYAISQIDTLATMEEDKINLGKFIVGTIGSTMVGDKMLKAALDGFAVVGIANYAKNLMNSTNTASAGATGVPYGTIGRIPARRVMPGLRRAGAGLMRGVGNVAAMVD